ncbi:MAG: DUF5011 domain-containing protein [Bacteroidales bacterium]
MKIPIQRLLVLILFAFFLFACNKDKNDPVITIVGDNPLTHCVNFLYFDFGAVAYDEEDGDITDKIVTTSSVAPSVVGTYTVKYSVEDNAGNRAEATRTVEVIQCK